MAASRIQNSAFNGTALAQVDLRNRSNDNLWSCVFAFGVQLGHLQNDIEGPVPRPIVDKHKLYSWGQNSLGLLLLDVCEVRVQHCWQSLFFVVAGHDEREVAKF